MRYRHRLTSSPLAATAFPLAALLLAAGMSVLATPALAAEPCVDTACTETFYYTGTQTSWTVPANLASLSVVVAGASGEPNITSSSSPAPGGVVTVDLPTTLGGESLAVLVGGDRKGSATHDDWAENHGGGGSYLALGDEFLVVSGGGGGGGEHTVTTPPPDLIGTRTSTVGGAGGAGGPGGTGASLSDPTAPGKGAVGAAPGAAGAGSVEAYSGDSGTVASISAGVITPGLGGYAGHSCGAGGGGYAGGGGGSSPRSTTNQDGSFTAEVGSGGGGSGFLAASLTATSTGTNVGDGYITFSYQLLASAAEEDPTDTSPTDEEPTLAASGGVASWQTPALGMLLLLGGGGALALARSRRQAPSGR